MSLRARTRFLVLIVKRENKSREDFSGSGWRANGRVSGEFLDDVAIVSGGVVDIRSNLVVISVIGPTRFGDPDPKIRIPEAFHGEDESVNHLVEEVVVGQIRDRIRYGDVGRFENGVIEIDVFRILGPGEIRVDVDEEERFGPV